MRTMTQSIISGIENRMRFIHIVERILDYTYPDNIKKMIPNRSMLDNLVIMVLLYIKERTLGNNKSCTITDIENFLEDIVEIVQEGYVIDCNELARFIIITALQNNGEIKEYYSYDSNKNAFATVVIRLIEEEHGNYRLTDDAFDFLFRSKEIESEIDYSVTRFKMREYLKRDNYGEALDQSKELISRIRNMKQSMDAFELRCRENTCNIALDEYETIIGRTRALLDDEYKELEDIEVDAKMRADKLKEASDSGIKGNDIVNNRKALKQILDNISITIEEQRKLINKRELLSKSFGKILEDSYAIKNYERLSFENDIMKPVRKLGDNMGDLVMNLFTPLLLPAFENMFSIENFYSYTSNIDIQYEKKEIDILDVKEIDNSVIEERDRINSEITKLLFKFIRGKKEFMASDFIHDLKLSQLSDYSKNNQLQEYLLDIFKLGNIDIERWKNSQNVIVEPQGELELSWCLSQIEDSDLDMKMIKTNSTNKIVLFKAENNDISYDIEMTDFRLEVIRE